MTDSSSSSVRVLEVASHVFVPMAGAMLGEWGDEALHDIVLIP